MYILYVYTSRYIYISICTLKSVLHNWIIYDIMLYYVQLYRDYILLNTLLYYHVRMVILIKGKKYSAQ